MSGEDAYTLEFECIAEHSEGLMNELMKTPLGQRAVELINQANFMPEVGVKTKEEIEAEAQKEQQAITEREESIKTYAEDNAKRVRDYHWKRILREKIGDEKTDEIAEAMTQFDNEVDSGGG